MDKYLILPLANRKKVNAISNAIYFKYTLIYNKTQ